MERARANALRLPPVRPPDDELLAEALVELRTLEGDVREAIRSGTPTAQLERRQVTVERKIRSHARLAPGLADSDSAGLDIRDLRDRLAGRVFVEYLESDDVLCAVVVDGTRSRLHTVGPLAEIKDQLSLLLFGVRRLAAGIGSPAALAAIQQRLVITSRALETDLLHGIGVPADTELIIVPSAALRPLPWSALPSARRRSVSVAPSAGVWLRWPVPAPSRPRVALVAGPDLQEAGNEVRSIRTLYDDHRVLEGPEATSEATLEIAEGADILHIAAHGTFRADSPMFSALHLADGPLTIYDLERLRIRRSW